MKSSSALLFCFSACSLLPSCFAFASFPRYNSSAFRFSSSLKSRSGRLSFSAELLT